jgi:hypothetical protein
MPPFAGNHDGSPEICGICGLRRCRPSVAVLGWPRSVGKGYVKELGVGMAKSRAAAKKVSCEDCYFRCNLLCALNLDEPCATFRPDHPDGLRPPRQMRFHFRQERRTQATWAFPTAQEQAALHR